jgi:benzodiazapine receptor
VAASAGAVTATSVGTWYMALQHPPGTPPNWLFGPVWTVLYVMIGVAGWLIWLRGSATPVRRPLRLWGWQLLCNALWTPAFFGLHSPALGVAVIVVLLGLVGVTIAAFRRIRPTAAWLMAPYAAWTCFACYLNLGIWWLNW